MNGIRNEKRRFSTELLICVVVIAGNMLNGGFPDTNCFGLERRSGLTIRCLGILFVEGSTVRIENYLRSPLSFDGEQLPARSILSTFYR